MAVEGRASWASTPHPQPFLGRRKARSPQTCLPGTPLPPSAVSLVAAIIREQRGEGGVTFRHQTTWKLYFQLRLCKRGLLATRSLAVHSKMWIMESMQQKGLKEST